MRNRPLQLDELLDESSWVRRVAYGLLRDSHEAEDVAQEVLAAAYRQQPTASGAHLRAWLRTVTRRKVATKVQVERNRTFAERQAARAESADASVADRVALHKLLGSAVDELPPLLGEAVLLRYFDGLTSRQVARKLGVTREAARQRVSRGLKLLRLRLDRDADPDDPQRGRELWSTALVGTLGLPNSGPIFAAAPLVLMSLKAKALLAMTAACVAAIFLARPPGGADTVEPRGFGVSQGSTGDLEGGTAALSGTLTVAGSAPEHSREVIPASAQTEAGRWLQIRTQSGDPPLNARAAWVDNQGASHPIEVSRTGLADMAAVPARERVWVCADGNVPGFVDLVPERAITEYELDPALVVPGILIEDGGIPRARTTLEVRWIGPFEEELDADGAPEKMRRAMGFSYQLLDLQPDGQGRFRVPGIPSGTELRFSLPSSHLFGLEASDESNRCTRTALEGETIELRTIRTLSISARVLRADNGRPAMYCPVYFHFRDQAGNRRDVLHDQCDREGFFSAGFVPPGWRSMTALEREEERERWVHVGWVFAPKDPSLERLKGGQPLGDGEFFVDLGDLHLDAKPVIDAVVFGADGAPLAQARVRCPNGTILRSNSKGELQLPGAVLEGQVTVMALGHSLRHFTSSELAPGEEGVIALHLEAGIELHVSIAEESRQTLASTRDPNEDYRISVSWEETPFLRSPNTPHPFDFQLHGELWDLNEGLGGFDSEDGPETCTSLIPESGVVRLFSLRAGAPIQVRLRGGDGSILSSIDLRVPEEPGVHECKLTLPAAMDPNPPGSFRIVGHVLDEASVPLPGVSVTYDLEDVRGYLETDANGRFESGPLPVTEWPTDSPFKIWMRAEGHVDLSREWSSQAPTELSQLLFIMPRARQIEIHAVDALGNAAPIDRVTLVGHPDIEFEGEVRSPGVWVSEVAPCMDLRLVVHKGESRHFLDLGGEEATGRIFLDDEGR